MKKAKNSLKFIAIAAISSVFLFIIFGIPTALVPTGIFKRMIEITILDYVFLSITSVLLGSYISIHFYKKSRAENKDSYAALGGGIGGVFAFGCPICNIILVSLFGATAILTLYEPLRPLIGVFSIFLLVLALYSKTKCFRCSKKHK